MFLLISLLRKIGFKLHRWESTHSSNCERRCLDCGEEQSYYIMNWEYPWDKWWETSKDGNGKCGVKPIPIRYL